MHRMLMALALVETAPPDQPGMSFSKNLFEGGAGVLVNCVNGTEAAHINGDNSVMVLSEKIRDET
jgi:hypothetical protein